MRVRGERAREALADLDGERGRAVRHVGEQGVLLRRDEEERRSVHLSELPGLAHDAGEEHPLVELLREGLGELIAA